MTPPSTSVTFRGEDREVTIDRDYGYESDTNAHVIEWHFAGLTPEQHDALNITDAEDQAIYEVLVQSSYDRAMDGDL